MCRMPLHLTHWQSHLYIWLIIVNKIFGECFLYIVFGYLQNGRCVTSILVAGFPLLTINLLAVFACNCYLRRSLFSTLGTSVITILYRASSSEFQWTVSVSTVSACTLCWQRQTSRGQGSKPLKVHVMNTRVVAHQAFALRILTWLQEVIGYSGEITLCGCY